jgi:hypothetical protein
MEGAVMRKVCTLIFAGCVSLASSSVYAQFLGGGFSTEAMIQELAIGGGASGNIGNIVENITGQIIDAAATTAQPIAVIEAPLTVDAVVPEVNLTTAATLDTIGRYPPRLRINFAEFPLRSLSSPERSHHRSNNGDSIAPRTQADIVVQRIQNRLRIPDLDLVVEDRTATISGMVATERQRSLAESMLRFEPGIDVVRNEITITPQL